MLDEVRENAKKIKETLKKWEHYLLKREENTYQQLDKDRRQELLYLFIFEAHNKNKSFAKQSWFIKGKMIEEKRDYCKIEIQENKSEHKSIQKGSVWKVHKHVIKPCNR